LLSVVDRQNIFLQEIPMKVGIFFVPLQPQETNKKRLRNKQETVYRFSPKETIRKHKQKSTHERQK
jgi:hypothetical protein